MKDCDRCGKWRDPTKPCIHCSNAAKAAAELAAPRAVAPPASSPPSVASNRIHQLADEITSEPVLDPFELDESDDSREVAHPVAPETRSGGPAPPAPEFPKPARAAAPRPEDLTRAEALQRWEAVLDNSPVFADPRKPRPETPPQAPPFLVPFDFKTQDVITTSPIGAPVDGDSTLALEVAIDARFDVSSAPRDSDPAVDLLVTMTPLGPALLDPKAGPVAHLILALDLSASMNAADKYPVLTRALTGMLADLHKDGASPVLISVVVFAYGAETILRAVPSKELTARHLLDALDGSPLRFSRYTDVVGALHRAGRLAYDSVRANKAMPVRIYLMTDGRPQDVGGARDVMERIHRLPVDIDGLGFGEDADIACLKSLISGGRGGTVKQIRSDTIEEAFGRIGDLAQRLVAPRAILNLDLVSGVVGGMAYRFRPARHRYGDDAFEMGRKFSRDLGTLESGRTYSMLFQVRLPVAVADESEIGLITLRVPGRGGPRVFEKFISIPRHDGPAETERDPEVAAARDVLEALDNDDPKATLRALRMRRQLYEREQRDARVLEVLDRAIDELERHGSLAALSASDHAALISHTMTKRGGRMKKAPAKTEAAAS